MSTSRQGKVVIHQTVRITRDENQRLIRAAKRLDMSFNKFAKRVLLEKADKVLARKKKVVGSEDSPTPAEQATENAGV